MTDECPICLNSIEINDDYIVCSLGCGKPVHTECYTEYAVSKGYVVEEFNCLICNTHYPGYGLAEQELPPIHNHNHNHNNYNLAAPVGGYNIGGVGGLMQLVAYGAQDIYLTGNPTITYFRVQHKQHTNFETETIKSSKKVKKINDVYTGKYLNKHNNSNKRMRRNICSRFRGR